MRLAILEVRIVVLEYFVDVVARDVLLSEKRVEGTNCKIKEKYALNYISQRKKKNDDDDSDDNDEELKQQQQQRVYIDKLQFFSGFSKLCKNVN